MGNNCKDCGAKLTRKSGFRQKLTFNPSRGFSSGLNSAIVSFTDYICPSCKARKDARDDGE